MHAQKPWKLINAKNKQIGVLQACIGRQMPNSQNMLTEDLMSLCAEFKGL